MMTPDQSAAYVMGQAACLMAEIAGMQADNERARQNDQYPVHDLDAFKAAINRYSCHHSAACQAFNEANNR